MINNIRFCGFVIFALLPGMALSGEADLAGHWYETNNYPASSVIKFERVNNSWIGRYAQVSVFQKSFGFIEGEEIIRGLISGDTFKGEVLLKWSPSVLEKCQNYGQKSYWSRIEMKLVDSDKLYGAWLQADIDLDQGCTITSKYWQTYGLERLKLTQ